MVRPTVVRLDGRITVFPIGDVVAAGRTPVELQAELIRLLAGEYRQPRVTVEVVKSAANRVHVLGRVKKPGSQVVQSLPTLLQVIAEAGGFEDDAARNSVIIMHRVGLGSVSVARIRADRLLRGGGDVPLSRFDIVYVPRSTIGNVDVFVDQFFARTIPVGATALARLGTLQSGQGLRLCPRSSPLGRSSHDARDSSRLPPVPSAPPPGSSSRWCSAAAGSSSGCSRRPWPPC